MRRLTRRISQEQSGFTLVEMLVAMTMMIIVMFALYNIFDMSIKVFSLGNDKLEATENARLGLDKMAREIRAAYPVDKVNGHGYIFFNASDVTKTNDFPANAPPPTMPTSTQITFGNDLDGDGKVSCLPLPAKCEYITYRLDSSGTTLLRNNTVTGSDTSTGGDPVVEHVKNLNFTYLKRDGTVATTESDISIVRITLTTEINRGNLGVRTQTLTTDVALRNRM